jgi:hypothetical protein
MVVDTDAERRKGGTMPDSDRGNNPSEPADPDVIARAADEAVLDTDEFPSGGGPGGTPGKPISTDSGGSTGRNAVDSGKTDAEGTPGGGMAGSAGG